MSLSKKERHKRLLKLKDKDIDYSDIPALDKKDFERELLSIPPDISDWLRKKDKNIINALRILKDLEGKHT